MARYTYATGYIDAVAVQERDLNGDDDFADDDEVVYYHSNTLYSVYALSDADENVVERMRYDAYGAATVLDSDFSSDADGASDVENLYAFTGRRLDLESDLMQYRHRYYDPDLGRFISRDPIDLLGGNNFYELVWSRPTEGRDPTGLKGDCVDIGWRRNRVTGPFYAGHSRLTRRQVKTWKTELTVACAAALWNAGVPPSLPLGPHENMAKLAISGGMLTIEAHRNEGVYLEYKIECEECKCKGLLSGLFSAAPGTWKVTKQKTVKCRDIRTFLHDRNPPGTLTASWLDTMPHGLSKSAKSLVFLWCRKKMIREAEKFCPPPRSGKIP